MFGKKLIALRATLLCLLTVVPLTTATAKPTPPEPDGLQAGGFVMHPGATLSVAYDMKGNQGADDGLVDVGVFFHTHLTDETTKTWDNEIDLKWRQFWGVSDAKADGGLDVNLSTTADLFKLGIFRLKPSFTYQYLAEPQDENLRQDFQNHTIRGGVGFVIQPGQGAIFSEEISYRVGGRLYTEHSDISNFSHRIQSLTRWNFLPNSAMTLTANVTISHFLEDVRRTSGDQTGSTSGGTTQNSTSYPVRVKYGLQGLLLPRLSYALGLGYAYVNYENDLSEHMFVMNARLAYSFRPNIDLALEYRKDFENATFGDYYKFHRAGLAFHAIWFDKFETNAEVAYGHFDFKSTQSLNRIDNLFIAKAALHYYFIPSVKLGFEYTLNHNDSDYDLASYTKHYFSLSFAYEY